MNTIYKYEIGHTGDVTLELPERAQILHFAVQGEVPCIWALVDPMAAVEQRRFLMFGTGHPIEDASTLQHVGSCFQMGGALVWHLFEKR